MRFSRWLPFTEGAIKEQVIPLPDRSNETLGDEISENKYKIIYDILMDFQGGFTEITDILTKEFEFVNDKLDDLNTKIASLEIKTKEAIRKDEELFEIKKDLKSTNSYVQELFANLVRDITNKSTAHDKLNPNVAKYIARKNGEHLNLP